MDRKYGTVYQMNLKNVNSWINLKSKCVTICRTESVVNSILSELNCLYNILYDVNYIVDFSKLYLCTNYCLINLDLKQSIIYLLMF